MQALTLTELFGASATQTATELVIKKADLVAVGLTPQADNRAEQLLVAILVKALSNFQGYLTDESGNFLSDETGNIIGYDNRENYEFIEMQRWDAYIKERQGNVYLTETIIIHSYAQAN